MQETPSRPGRWSPGENAAGTVREAARWRPRPPTEAAKVTPGFQLSVCLGCSNTNTRDWEACKPQSVISHSPGGWEVQDQGPGRLGVCCCS